MTPTEGKVYVMKRLIILGVLIVSPVRADDVISETIRPASDRFAQRDAQVVPDFQRHVVPLLGKLGCNSAKCHGSFQGQGNFRLSLFGFDFQSDHQALHADADSEQGLRLHLNDPENSLFLRKATEQTDHEIEIWKPIQMTSLVRELFSTTCVPAKTVSQVRFHFPTG